MASRRRQSPQRLILDSGAVIALSRKEARARAFLARALENGADIEIPVAVVAETVRGHRWDAPVQRVLKAVAHVPDMTENHGRTAGRLLGLADSSATVDALVVAHAVEAGGGQVLTGDVDDLKALSVEHPEVQIRSL